MSTVKIVWLEIAGLFIAKNDKNYTVMVIENNTYIYLSSEQQNIRVECKLDANRGITKFSIRKIKMWDPFSFKIFVTVVVIFFVVGIIFNYKNFLKDKR